MKILLLTLLLGTMIYANNIECKEDGSQMQMNFCAYEEFQKADKSLNKVYKALRHRNKNDKIYLVNLKISQRLWIKFRDAELALVFSCNYEDKRQCFGSMYPLLYNSEKTSITEQRVKSLEKYLKEEKF
ncbi:MAG: lysozyme inhibitor LprI family protein [Sulfurovum sp.]|nr:lysozyme inhibitor LprI family protein [Sulfurovum sp.]